MMDLIFNWIFFEGSNAERPQKSIRNLKEIGYTYFGTPLDRANSIGSKKRKKSFLVG